MKNTTSTYVKGQSYKMNGYSGLIYTGSRNRSYFFTAEGTGMKMRLNAAGELTQRY